MQIHSLGALGFTVSLPLRLDDYARPIPYLVPGLEVKGLFGVTSECRTPSAECRMQNREGGPGLPTGPASDIELMSKIVVRRIGSILRK